MSEDENIPIEIDKLKDDLIWTRHYFEQYKKIFVENEHRIELLNDTAPNFFRDVQRLLWYQTIIGVGRLTDKHKQGSNINLSIGVLPFLAANYQWNFLDELQESVDEAIAISKPIRKWRMKVVAHRDLPTALSNVENLEKVHIDQIEESLTAIGSAINIVYSKLIDTSWSWKLVTSHDSEELIHYLKLAKVYQEKIRKSEGYLQADHDWVNSKYRNA